jgi:hypothetical protein
MAAHGNPVTGSITNAVGYGNRVIGEDKQIETAQIKWYNISNLKTL